jgi:hypothetical protein
MIVIHPIPPESNDFDPDVEPDIDIETETLDAIVQPILGFIRHLKALRSPSKIPLQDDELTLLIVLSLLADPHHWIGKKVTRHLFKVWIERGGKIPNSRSLSKSLYERDCFEFACQYLYDLKIPVQEIAMALGVTRMTIYNTLRFLRDEDFSMLHSTED